jgi:aspartate ammonia-lyase
MNNSRFEHDFLGERSLPNDAYYGIQTLRALENFAITGIPINTEPLFVQALAFVKKAAALANRDLGVLGATTLPTPLPRPATGWPTANSTTSFSPT